MALKIFGYFTLLLLVHSPIALSGPLDNWTWRNPLPTGSTTLSGVAFGNGSFAAVGEFGTIVTSVDGTNWVQRQSGTLAWLRGVAYGNGLFVAVGGQADVVVSTNGVSWEQCESPPELGVDSWAPGGITYGNGLFVACGAGTTATSMDGRKWVQNQIPASLVAVAYGNGLFVAADRNPTNNEPGTLWTSTDGVTWVPRQTVAGSLLNGVTYGDSQFVAVGDYWGPGPDIVMTSSDGVTWIRRNTGTQYGLYQAAAYGHGLFVAAGLGTDYVTSTNAIDWQVSQLVAGGVYGIAYGNGQFVAVGLQGAVLTSVDGVNWIDHRFGQRFSLSRVRYGGGRFVAVGADLDGSGVALASDDGLQWIAQKSVTQNGLYDVAFGGGQLAAVGDSGNIATSGDGTNWIQRQSGTQNRLSGIAYGGRQFVAAGDSGTILTSIDGVDWIQRQSDVTNDLVVVTFNNGLFVAGGDSTNILTSNDGVAWSARQSGAQELLVRGIAYGNGQFLALDAGGATLTSADGTNWVQRSPRTLPRGLADAFFDVVYFNGQFLQLVNDPLGEFSGHISDSNGWHVLGTNIRLTGMAYGNGHFVAVGAGGGILQSGSLISLQIVPSPATGLLSLSLTGPIASAYTIQSSSDLISWKDLTNVSTALPTTIVPITSAPSTGPTFYRAYTQ